MTTCKYIPFIQLVMNALLVSMDKHHCNRYPDTASFSLCQVEGAVCLCLELMFFCLYKTADTSAILSNGFEMEDQV